jgi:hypothetical protein
MGHISETAETSAATGNTQSRHAEEKGIRAYIRGIHTAASFTSISSPSTVTFDPVCMIVAHSSQSSRDFSHTRDVLR